MFAIEAAGIETQVAILDHDDVNFLLHKQGLWQQQNNCGIGQGYCSVWPAKDLFLTTIQISNYSKYEGY